MAPPDFAKIKRVLATYPTRNPLRRSKDLLQARLVEKLVSTHVPQFVHGDSAVGGNSADVEPSPNA